MIQDPTFCAPISLIILEVKMSNHSGSYMLNEILQMLEKNKFFEFMGKEKTHEFFLSE